MRLIALLFTFIAISLPAQYLAQNGQKIIGGFEQESIGLSVQKNYDGSIMAVGSTLANGRGKVQVFTKEGNIWVQLGEDIENEHPDVEFGSSIALSADGLTLAIGAQGDYENYVYDRGSVEVYEYADSQWSKLGSRLLGDLSDEAFGTSVSLDSSGTVLAVSSKDSRINGAGSGEVNVYHLKNENWELLGQTLEGESRSNSFGFSMSLSANGERLLVGVARHSNDNGQFAG